MSELPKKTAPRFSASKRRRLAETLAEHGLAAGESARIRRRSARAGPSPVTNDQERLLVAEQLLGETPLYHVPLAAHMVGPLDSMALQRSLDALIRRHDLLRARFAQDGERLVQHTTDDSTLSLTQVDVTGVASERRYARALELARAEFRRPFALDQRPPIRASLWRLGAEDHLLLLSLHHAVCDGTTMRILCEELT